MKEKAIHEEKRKQKTDEKLDLILAIDLIELKT